MAQPQPPYQEDHVILLIDRSGSMVQPRANGNTRFQEAIKRAREFTELTSSIPRYYAVWSFEGTSYTKHQGFTLSASTTLATLNSLRVGTGVTPLALAACDAVDELKAFRSSLVFARKTLRLGSDGEENSSPSGTQCQGPNSVGVYPALDAQSWQWKVRNKLRTGNAQNSNVAPFTIIFDVDAFFKFISLRAPQPEVRELTDQGEPVALAGVTLPQQDPFLAYITGMSADSGGKSSIIDDSAAPPVFGDVNKDGCVGNSDYDLVIANYGLYVPPAPSAADVNGDSVVDYNDYAIVIGNWGMGGNCGIALGEDRK